MKKQEQLKYLKIRFYLFIDFLEQKDLNSTGVQVIEQMKQTVESSFDSDDLNSLRALNHEVDRWTKELPTHKDTLEFYKILKNQLGEDYPKSYYKQLNRIRKIGIRTNNEYEIVQDRINQIYQDNNSTDEIEHLNSLLHKFTKTHPNNS